MKVQELREFIEFLPDDMEVLIDVKIGLDELIVINQSMAYRTSYGEVFYDKEVFESELDPEDEYDKRTLEELKTLTFPNVLILSAKEV